MLFLVISADGGDDGDKSVRVPPAGSTQRAPHADRETDSALYRSFCALRACLRAVSFDACDATEDAYDREVTRRLRAADRLLRALRPPAYRLEMLENVFSLLFLTGADAAEGEGKGAGCRRVGFTAHPLVVRDVLLSLKLHLIQLTPDVPGSSPGERLPPRGGSGPGERLPPRGSGLGERRLPSSVGPTCLAVRLGRLTQYVSEALWRFQLICPHVALSGGLVTDDDSGGGGGGGGVTLSCLHRCTSCPQRLVTRHRCNLWDES